MAKKHPPKLEKVLRKLAHAVKHAVIAPGAALHRPPGSCDFQRSCAFLPIKQISPRSYPWQEREMSAHGQGVGRTHRYRHQ